jgi:hypothetical protein
MGGARNSRATTGASASTATDVVHYDRLIARHLETRLRAFERKRIDVVLDRCNLEWDQGVIRSRDGAPLGPGISRQYKHAVLEEFGSGVYEMTKVNFTLAGCRCADCMDATSDAG